jgi:hypothetical protein
MKFACSEHVRQRSARFIKKFLEAIAISSLGGPNPENFLRAKTRFRDRPRHPRTRPPPRGLEAACDFRADSACRFRRKSQSQSDL